MCSVIKGRASSLLTFLMNVKLSEKDIKHTENARKRKEADEVGNRKG